MWQTLTIVFLIIMPQDKFVLDVELVQYKEALKHQLCLNYGRSHSDLHLENYKIYFEGVESNDLATMVNAKVVSSANVLDDVFPNQWPTIFDSFETDS